MATVEIYTKAFCPYCSRARGLLDSKGAEYSDTDISMTPGARDDMLSRSGGRMTVPQIFIDGQHIGGCDDLYALEARGGLDPLLHAA